MKISKAGIVACVALSALMFYQTSRAQTNAPAASAPNSSNAASAPAFSATVCEHPADATREAADQRTVDAAINAANSGGYPALAPHLDALRDVLAHAPSCYPEVERRGDEIIVRSNADPSAVLALLLVAVGHQITTGEHQNLRVVRSANPYAYASLLLGANSNEMHRFDEGLAWLDQGLALQPHEQQLILEKATALGQLRRFDEQIALLQAELADPFASLSLDQSRYQRNLGVALIDANRLDEAEAALRESIRLEPNNPRARNELQYIAQLRAGGQRTDANMAHIGDTPAHPQR